MKVLILLILCVSAGSILSSAKASDFKPIDEEETSSELSSGAGGDKASKPALKENEEVLTGTPTVIRNMGGTEVFFKDLSDSYYISSGSHYNEVFTAMKAGTEKNSKVTFKVNKKSRRILSLEEAPPAPPAPAAEPSPIVVPVMVGPSSQQQPAKK